MSSEQELGTVTLVFRSMPVCPHHMKNKLQYYATD